MGISLSNVIFSYPHRPKKIILNIPEWKINSGELVLIQGPSGSGKTTFLNIIAGLFRPLKGSVKVLGKRLDQMSSLKCDSHRANNIGYVFQNFNLIPYLNVIDNIYLAAKFSKQLDGFDIDHEIGELLTTLNISEKDWNLKSRNLSVGQTQRVAIARAMINRPKIIIADEPTSSLDPTNKEKFINLLMKLVNKYKITLVFVSHDQSLSSYFNRVELFSEINVVDKNL